MKWNHNVHYHGAVIRAIPSPCRDALDVGCGKGGLARKLVHHCGPVLAIDVDRECIESAKSASELDPRITFREGDVLSPVLPEESFDFVVAMATLHHLPLRDGLERFRKLLRPGGVLCVVGLYRKATTIDYLVGGLALAISWTIRKFKGEEEVGAPVRFPVQSLREIRTECDSLLPGGSFQRRLFFRYSFIWKNLPPKIEP